MSTNCLPPACWSMTKPPPTVSRCAPNSWSAFTELEICGEAEAESNALFGGVQTRGKELQQLDQRLDCTPTLLSPKFVSATEGEVMYVVDNNFETRWSTENTGREDDLDNSKLMFRFGGEVSISQLKIAFFDGHLARQHFSVYTQSATATRWTSALDHVIADMHEKFQTFDIYTENVNQLYIVGNGNDVGSYTKISEVQIYGC